MTAQAYRAAARLALNGLAFAALLALGACAPGQHVGKIGVTWEVYDSDSDPGVLVDQPEVIPAGTTEGNENGQS